MTTSVTVIGGGIAGLTTAYRLRQAHPQLKITLVERDERLGGKIATVDEAGFVIEGGPDSFQAQQKLWALELARELGLEQRFLSTNDAQRKIYLLRHGKLRLMPDGLMLVVPTRFMPFVRSPIISLPGKLRMALDLFIPRRKDDSDESVASFIRRRLGREALEVLAGPMMGGIRGADPETLSLQATFPRFIDVERKYRSLIRGMVASRRLAGRKSHSNVPSNGADSMFVSLHGGLRELVAALEKALSDVQIKTGQAVTALRHDSERYQVTLSGAESFKTDAVVLAIPAFAAAELCASADLSASLAAGLREIRYATTATVSLGFKRTDVKHSLNGFGFLVPASEPAKIVACTWTSTKFKHRAPDDTVLLRAFVGGPHGAQHVQLDDAGMVAMVREELEKILGIRADPIVARVFNWDRANPQYDVGHLELVARLEKLCPPGLFLTGSSYRGVGIPDCVRQGNETAEQVRDYLQTLSTAFAIAEEIAR